jgi:hypothetical protein
VPRVHIRKNGFFLKKTLKEAFQAELLTGEKIMLTNNFKFTNFQAKGITSIILFIIISIAVFFRLEVFDGIIVNEWIARDFDRAFYLYDKDYIPLTGPEKGNGGRLQGPFLGHYWYV